MMKNSDNWQILTRKPTHPGEILREEFMAEMGISVALLAGMLGVSRQTVNELVHERRGMSPDMALRLGKLFDMSPQSWMSLQADYDLWESYALNRRSINKIKPYEHSKG